MCAHVASSILDCFLIIIYIRVLSCSCNIVFSFSISNRFTPHKKWWFLLLFHVSLDFRPHPSQNWFSQYTKKPNHVLNFYGKNMQTFPGNNPNQSKSAQIKKNKMQPTNPNAVT